MRARLAWSAVAAVGCASAAPVDTDAAGVCLSVLNDPFFPTTWTAVASEAEVDCVTTARCDGSAEAALTVWADDCEGSWRGYYDAAGDLVAENEQSDAPTCREDVFERWYGAVIDACVPADASASRGCARPWSPPAVDGAQRVTATGEPWTDAQARLAGTCHGTIGCALPSGQDVLVTYAYEACGTGRYDVYDLAAGHVGGGTDDEGVGVPDLDEGDLAALATCLGGEFAPSEACGVVAP